MTAAVVNARSARSIANCAAASRRQPRICCTGFLHRRALHAEWNAARDAVRERSQARNFPSGSGESQWGLGTGVGEERGRVGSGIHAQTDGHAIRLGGKDPEIYELDGWTYRRLLAPEYGITNQVLGGVVDTRLPDRLEELPSDADLPNRFFIYSAFGDGWAKMLGTVFGAGGVCMADSVPMEVSDRFLEGANRVREAALRSSRRKIFAWPRGEE